jgi:hypothetical protein
VSAKLRLKPGANREPGSVHRTADGRRWRLTGGVTVQPAPSQDRGYEAEKVRKAVLARDGYKCVNCPSSEDLWVCHSVPWSESPGLRYDMWNLMTLCPRCDPDRNHRIVYRRYPWLRQALADQEASRLELLLGSPYGHEAPASRVLARWLLQGFLVWLCAVLPLWWLYQALVLHGLPTLNSLGWWLLTQPPVSVAGVYLARYLYRRRRFPKP